MIIIADNTGNEVRDLLHGISRSRSRSFLQIKNNSVTNNQSAKIATNKCVHLAFYSYLRLRYGLVVKDGSRSTLATRTQQAADPFTATSGIGDYMTLEYASGSSNEVIVSLR